MKVLYEAMVINFFPFDIDHFTGIGLICLFKIVREENNKTR